MSVILIGALVVVPVLLVSGRIIEAVGGGAVAVRDKLASGEWRQVTENDELLAPVSRWVALMDFDGALEESVTAWLLYQRNICERVGTKCGRPHRDLLSAVLFPAGSRGGSELVSRDVSALKLEMELLFDRVADTVRATLYGTDGTVVQGTLGGLMFGWLGLPMPVFWGVVMGLLAIVPMLGAFVVWSPPRPT